MKCTKCNVLLLENNLDGNNSSVCDTCILKDNAIKNALLTLLGDPEFVKNINKNWTPTPAFEAGTASATLEILALGEPLNTSNMCSDFSTLTIPISFLLSGGQIMIDKDDHYNEGRKITYMTEAIKSYVRQRKSEFLDILED